MKTYPLLSGLLSCALLLASCQQESQTPKPELSISIADVLSIQSEESETIIEVSTNMPKWAAVCNASWLDLRKLANSLVLTSTPNTTATTRVAQIVITSGGLTRTIRVEQLPGGTLPLELIPASSIIDKDGGEIRLVAKTKLNDWHAKTTADWLEILSRPRQGELVLRAQPNSTDETREANIEITSGQLSHTVKIRQYGQLKYYEPFNLFGQNLDQINALERRRGSKLIQEPAPPSAANPQGIPDYTYQTTSSAFPTVKYEFIASGNEMLYSTTLVSALTPTSITQDVGFTSYLQEQGYLQDTQRSIPKIQVYRNEKQKVELYIRVKSVPDPKDKNKKLTQDLLFFRPMLEQPEAMPTLDKLFYGPAYPGTMTLDAIAEWEAKNGGHYDKEFSNGVIGQPFFFAEEPFYGRLYFNPEKLGDKVDEYLFFYLDYKVAFYRFGAMYYPTSEFETLLQKDGFSFVYYNPESRIYYYTNKERKLGIICQARPFGPRIMFRLRIFADNPTQARSANLIDRSMSSIDLKDDIYTPISKHHKGL